MLRTRLLAVAACAALVGGVGFASASLASSTATAPVIHGCVNNITHALTKRVGLHCKTGSTALNWNVQGQQGVQGVAGPAGPQGPAGPAGPAVLTVTSALNIVNDPDSNNSGGTWATDTISRTVTLTRHGAAPLTDCKSAPAGNDTCYYYTGTVSDNGTFVTINGAASPNDASKTVNGVLNGSLVGGTSVEFYADSASLQSSSLSVVDASKVTTDGVSDAGLYESFFPKNTTVDSVNLPNWDWSYTAPSTCESMTQAFSGETGNITGTNACTS